MSWQLVDAGDLMARRNSSINPANFSNEQFELHSIPAFDLGRPEVLSGSEIGSAKQAVQPDDVMISKIVPHIRRSSVVGKSSGLRQIASGEWIVFRSERFYPHYLRHFLISNQFNAQFMATVSGVGGSLLRARPAEVAKIKIPLPPVNEQLRIAAILDKADALRAHRSAAIAKLDELLQSVFIEMFGDPVRNPKGWAIGSLSAHGSYKNGLNFGKGESGETVRFVGVGDFQARAALDDFGSLGFIELNDLPAEDFFLHDGDLLFVRSNGNRELVGRCMAVYPGVEKVTYSGFCIRYRIADVSLQSTYVAHLFRSVPFRRLIFQGGQGANIQNINQQILSDLPIPIPDEGLQNQFAAIVEKIEAQKLSMQRAAEKSDALFASLQQLAFSGKL